MTILLVGSLLASCGSITVPAAVQMDSGEAMIGTTTASASGGHFEVRSSRDSGSCGGTYDALDTHPTISVPVKCSDGRYGVATVTRTPDMMAGSGTVTLADGSAGHVAFGRLASSVISVPRDSFNSPTSASPSPDGSIQPAVVASPSYSAGGSTACHSENYYGSLSCVTGLPRTTYVGGYLRKNGTYVHSYFRSHK